MERSSITARKKGFYPVSIAGLALPHKRTIKIERWYFYEASCI